NSSSNSSDAPPHLIHKYQPKVGSIGHAAIFTRPNVAKSYSLLAESLTSPTQDDLSCTNQCIKYLYSTRYRGVLYHGAKGCTEVFNGASDAAFADDSQTRRSFEANLFRLFGGPIAWAAKKKPTVAKSTMEWELAAQWRAGSHHK
ncbi:Gag-Pol polyprotein, partial [Golovinomyces cichoracearum]